MIGNEWWDAAIKVFAMMSAVSLLRQAEPALNQMTRKTPVMVRLSFVLLAAGSGAIVLWAFGGLSPIIPAVMLSAGTAMLLSIDRRRGGYMHTEEQRRLRRHPEP